MNAPQPYEPDDASAPDVVAPEDLPEELMPSATGLLITDHTADEGSADEESALLAAGGDVAEAADGDVAIEGPNSA